MSSNTIKVLTFEMDGTCKKVNLALDPYGDDGHGNDDRAKLNAFKRIIFGTPDDQNGGKHITALPRDVNKYQEHFVVYAGEINDDNYGNAAVNVMATECLHYFSVNYGHPIYGNVIMVSTVRNDDGTETEVDITDTISRGVLEWYNNMNDEGDGEEQYESASSEGSLPYNKKREREEQVEEERVENEVLKA